MAHVRRAQIIWQGDTGQSYTITLDASVRETHTASSTVTDHPVERGSAVSDHIRPDPDTLTMEAWISNTPHFLPGDHMGGVVMADNEVRGAQITAGDRVNGAPFGGAAVGLVGSLAPVPTALLGQLGTSEYTTGVVTGFSAPFDRVTECYKELLRIRSDGVLVRVLTTLRAYSNLALTSLEVTREARSGNALQLSLAFKHVRYGSTRNEPVPKLPTKPAEKGSKTKDEKKEPADTETTALNLWLYGGK